MAIRSRAAVLVLSAMLATSCAGAAAPGPSSSPTPNGGIRTVSYCAPDGVPLAMDISMPQDSRRPRPAALYVHGGGWQTGSRGGGGFLDRLRPALLSRGFVVASIDYRLAPRYKWPAQIEDVKCAVRYLRANATVYGVDPNRIGAWGASAGGHLVSLLGTAEASAGFDRGEYAAESSRVEAVVDMYGPADLTSADWGPEATPTIREVFGAAPAAANDVLARASPVTYISAADPPFLILQGDADTTVPPSQSRELAQRLEAAGVSATLVLVRGGPHGLEAQNEQPSADQLVQMTADFFVSTLGAR